MELADFKQVYFLGIGGIGMSALARWFNHAGYQVSGYDSTKTILTQQLEEEGIMVHYHDDVQQLQNRLPSETLVVLTPAVPKTMQERVYLETHGFQILKRAQVLGAIANRYKGVAVAGTHGKTSISTMTAHIFRTSSFDCMAFLGGISKNYDTNLLLSSKTDYAVCEADEFDRSFLNLHPELALISSVDADHLDIYGTHQEMLKSFADFASQATANLVCKFGILEQLEQVSDKLNAKNSKTSMFSYSLDNEQADFYAKNIQLKNESYVFDLVHPSGCIENLQLNYPGLLNVENIVGASALSLLAGIDQNDIRQAVSSYSGVQRRFDVRYRDEKLILIDDYAHHPTELHATISSVRAMFPSRKITGVFQPHLYSRTKDFVDGFAKELSLVDELLLLDIYPARELPIEGITSDLIKQLATVADKRLLSREELEADLMAREEGLILMMGAGDISLSIDKLASYFHERRNLCLKKS
ncbi:MAG: UDP-N-acetylmuramate--L-alanine ligase [Mangrovibacterium sp.]